MSSTMHALRSQRLLMVLAAMVALMAACFPAANLSATAQDADPLATRVQFLHAGVDTGDVEVHVNGDKVVDDFSYGEVSDWLDVEPGGARVTLTADRIGFNYVIFDSVYPTPVGNDFYVVITDSLVLSGSFDTTNLPDDRARVQFLHASVGTPAVNLTATGDGGEATAQVEYSRNLQAVDVTAGTYTVDAALVDGGEALLSADVTVEAGNTYLVVLIGDPGSDEHPLELVTLQTGSSNGGATPVA